MIDVNKIEIELKLNWFHRELNKNWNKNDFLNENNTGHEREAAIISGLKKYDASQATWWL